MRRLLVLVQLAVMSTAVFAQDNARKEIQLAAGEQSLVAGNNQFAFNLFNKVRGDEDMLLSPLSVTYVLSMTNNGAAEETKAEIGQVLGFGNADTDAINAFCHKMLTETAALDDVTRISMANTIFVNAGQGYQLMPAFQQTANDFYGAEPQSRDFADGLTRDVINQWSSEHTQGMVPEILTADEYQDGAASYLLNALYFKGAWTLKFPKDSTREESFNGGDAVPTMRLAARLGYAERQNYQALNLPYGNEAFRMTVLLPWEGKTIDDVLSTMSAAEWEELSFQLAGGDSVNVKLPRIETSTQRDLRAELAALGMPSAFIGDGFPGICAGRDLLISKIKQVAKIKLDEEGTEAAAVTVVGMAGSAGPGSEPAEPTVRLFHATRPFLYVISEQSTNAIFFVGQYVGVDSNRSQGHTAIAGARVARPSSKVYTLDGREVTTPQRGHLYIRDGKKFVVK